MPRVNQPTPNYRTGEEPAVGDIITYGDLNNTFSFHYVVTRFTPSRIYYKDIGRPTNESYPILNSTYEDYTDKIQIRRINLVRRGIDYKKPKRESGFGKFINRIEADDYKSKKRRKNRVDTVQNW